MTTSFQPPLGCTIHATPNSVFRFRATTNAALVPQLWTNALDYDDSWSAIPFDHVGDNVWEAAVELVQTGNFHFTYRLMNPADGSLRWSGKANNDGTLIVSTGDASREDVLPKIKLSKRVTTMVTPDIAAHLVSFPVTADEQVIAVPNPISFERAVVLERPKPTWYEPKWITSTSEISSSNDAQFIVFDRSQSKQVAVLYPISTSEVVTAIRGNSKGGYSISAELEDATVQGATPRANVAVATGPDYAVADVIDAAIAVAKSLRKSSQPLSPPAITSFQALRFCTWNSLGPGFTLSKTLDAFSSFKKAGMFEHIDTVLLDDGWQDLGPRPVGGYGLQSFGAKEGWMDLGNATSDESVHRGLPRLDSGYLSSQTSPKLDDRLDDRAFQDLKRAVRELKSFDDGRIKRVGVWLTLAGYWGAIDPGSALAKAYDVRQWSTRDAFDHSTKPRVSDTWYLPSLDKVGMFWDDYFGTLKAAGVDYIKVDNQASIDYIYRCESHPKELAGPLRAAMHRGMHESANKHFGAGPSDDVGVINCMSHSPRTWGGASVNLAVDSEFRASDDFFPDQVESHSWHLTVNSLNALFLRALSFQPDFDMLMSKHRFAKYHASFRAFTPAPIYITDKPGEHDASTVQLLVAPLKQGGSAVVKTTNEIGSILSGRVFDLESARSQNDWGLLKVGLTLKAPRSAVLGIWNVHENQKAASDVITLRDVVDAFRVHKVTDDFEKPSSIALGFMKSGQAFVIDHLDWTTESKKSNSSSATVTALKLEAGEWDVVSLCPLYELPGPNNLRVGCVGLVEKACGLAGITNIGLAHSSVSQRSSVSQSAASRRFSVQSITSTISSVIDRGSSEAYQTVSQHGRIRHLLAYVGGDRSQVQPATSSSGGSNNTSLRQNMLRNPIQTILIEMKAMMRILLALAFLTATQVWSRVMNPSLITSGRSRSSSSSIQQGSVTEKTPLIEKKVNGHDEVFLRVETPFVGKLEFIVTAHVSEKGRGVVGQREVFVRVDGRVVEDEGVEFVKNEDGAYLKVVVDVGRGGSRDGSSVFVVEVGDKMT